MHSKSKTYNVDEIRIPGTEPTEEYKEYLEKERKGMLTPEDLKFFQIYRLKEKINSIKVNHILEQMVKGYRDVYGKDIVDIFLYGSFARGDNDGNSDIDFAAIVKGNRIELQDKLKLVWDISAEIGLENDVIISPMVIPCDEFLEYKDVLPYYMNIQLEGVKIG